MRYEPWEKYCANADKAIPLHCGNDNQGSGQNQNGQYTLTVQSGDTTKGTVTGGGTYSEGSRVNISATPKSGYQFEKNLPSSRGNSL